MDVCDAAQRFEDAALLDELREKTRPGWLKWCEQRANAMQAAMQAESRAYMQYCRLAARLQRITEAEFAKTEVIWREEIQPYIEEFQAKARELEGGI